MKLCDTCIYRNNVEQLKPCIIYRDDCEYYEKERGDMTRKEKIALLIDELGDIRCNNFDADTDEDKTLKEAVRVIKALEQKPKWIPCSERLPKKIKDVIVTDIETSDTYQSQYIGNGYWACDNGNFRNRIVAWMPLPEPYKSESEEV